MLLAASLTFDQGVVEYGADVLVKITQREMEPGRLIIPQRKLFTIFLRLEGIICSITESPRHFAVLGRSVWTVLKSAVTACEPEADVVEWLTQEFHSHFGRPASNDDASIFATLAELAVKYYVMSVRSKDAVQMQNAHGAARDGTDRISFRHKIAAKLMVDEVTNDDR